MEPRLILIQKRLLASNIKASMAQRDYPTLIRSYILLGDIYAEEAMAHRLRDWSDIVYAAGLWSYALNMSFQLIEPDFQSLINDRLTRLKNQFISLRLPHEHRFSSPQLADFNPTKTWSERLSTIRHSIQQRLANNPPTTIRNLYKHITYHMNQLFHDMLQLVIQQVSPSLDPHQFCIITAGSFAKHGTSFSDIEFAILIKDEGIRQQIYSIITLLFVYVLEFRETPIRALCIPELDFLYHDFEHMMHAGFRFDGGLSRLYPLPITDICSEIGQFTLVQTPEKMAELIRSHANCTKHMLTFNFIRPGYLMGNKGLYFHYMDLMTHDFARILPSPHMTTHALVVNQTRLDLDKYIPKLRELYVFKHEIYGVLNLFKSMKLMLGLVSDDHWNQLTELYTKRIISRRTLSQLNRLVNWIQFHRLKLYTTNHGQHDKMPVLLNHGIKNKYKDKRHVHYCLQDIHGLFFVFYSTALNLNQGIRDFLSHKKIKIDLSPKLPYPTILQFIANYLTRDNTTITKKGHHQLYAKIGNQMILDNAIDSSQNKNTIILSIRVLTCIANCQMQSSAPIFSFLLIEQCEQILHLLFTRAEKAIYANWANQSKKSTHELALLLCTLDPRLPTLVATLLYLKARCHFYGVREITSEISYQATIAACALRRWIDQAICDDTWNEFGVDTYTFTRSSLLYHRTDRAKTEDDFLSIIDQYKELLLHGDDIHRMECHHKLTQIYLKLQNISPNTYYVQQAKMHFNQVSRLSSSSTEFSSHAKFDKTRRELRQLSTSTHAFFASWRPRSKDHRCHLGSTVFTSQVGIYNCL